MDLAGTRPSSVKYHHSVLMLSDQVHSSPDFRSNGRIVVTVNFPEYLATSRCQKKGKHKGGWELESH